MLMNGSLVMTITQGGVFVVLLCGLAIAVIVAIFEFCYNSKRITKMERHTINLISISIKSYTDWISQKDHRGGVFVVLLCGLAIAVIVAIFEFCYNSKRITKMERRTSMAVSLELPPDLHLHQNNDLEIPKVHQNS
ncbi:uncharacterized protein LOC142326548 [Lycorma delicatula]|uniref:uncharacterized protein LOC142326548 n=1 Tax=Lycorma delicatula TaxID=130591 RepID=UPI003F51419D